MDPRQRIKSLLAKGTQQPKGNTKGDGTPKNLPPPGSNRIGDDFHEHPDFPPPAIRMTGTGTEKLSSYYRHQGNNTGEKVLSYLGMAPARGMLSLSAQPPLNQALIGAGTGAVAGVGFNLIRKLLGHRNASLGKGLLLGGLAGAGAGAGSGVLYRNNVARADRLRQRHATLNPPSRELQRSQKKYASFGAPDTGFLISQIMSAADISDMQKRHMVNLVHQLSPQQASQLSGALRRFSGAAIGYFIAQYLLKFNLGGRLLSAVAGSALIGSGRPNQKNVFGKTVF